MISLKPLVQALGQIVYEWRPSSSTLLWEGDYTRILGYSQSEMGSTTESWTGRVHPDDLDRVLGEVAACSKERRFYDLEYRFRRRDGSYLWMHDRGVPFFYPDGTLECMIGVFSDVDERRLAQEALRASAAALRELTRRVVQVEENERRKINQELHDRVGQGLSSLVLSLDLLRSQLPADAPPDVQRRLDDARALALRAVEDTRDVMAGLRPPALDEFGLLRALHGHAATVSARTGLKVEVSAASSEPQLSDIAQTALFRIAQEALVNVVKHASATRVDISLARNNGGAVLRISDNGKGFDPALAATGWGLKIMRERAEAVGAALRIEAQPGCGSAVTVDVPR